MLTHSHLDLCYGTLSKSFLNIEIYFSHWVSITKAHNLCQILHWVSITSLAWVYAGYILYQTSRVCSIQSCPAPSHADLPDVLVHSFQSSSLNRPWHFCLQRGKEKVLKAFTNAKTESISKEASTSLRAANTLEFCPVNHKLCVLIQVFIIIDWAAENKTVTMIVCPSVVPPIWGTGTLQGSKIRKIEMGRELTFIFKFQKSLENHECTKKDVNSDQAADSVLLNLMAEGIWA